MVRIALLSLLLLGCVPKPRVIVETQEIYIPVEVRAEVPDVLKEPASPMVPSFNPGNDPSNVIGLDIDNANLMKAYLYSLVRQLCLWEAYGGVVNPRCQQAASVGRE